MAPRALIYLHDVDDYTAKLIANAAAMVEIEITDTVSPVVTEGEFSTEHSLMFRLTTPAQCEDMFKLLAEVFPVADPEWFEHDGDVELADLARAAKAHHEAEQREKYSRINRFREFCARNMLIAWFAAGALALTYWVLVIYGGIK